MLEMPLARVWTCVFFSLLAAAGASPPVAAAPSEPGPTTVSCGYSTGDDCWVTGSFTASVTPATEASGIAGYRICRSVDSSGGFAGCDADLVPVGSGGTSVSVAGSHLASDGYRRAYYFQAKDNDGDWGPWNVPRYVRVDRNTPTLAATNASNDWFPSRTATVSAADGAGGAAANSGLAEVRYRWGTALNASCTSGTATASGAILTAPTGDNLLYLCARDRAGRVATWNGRYRVDPPPTMPGPTTVACAYAIADDCWVSGNFTATAAASTDSSGIAGYRICRSVDSTGGFAGCDADLVTPGSGGTSIAVSGTHLAGDGYRRAYYFQAKDNGGMWSEFNAPRYVRIDRNAPAVSATGASPDWFASRSATVAAADSTGGAAANSGLAEVRYRWNTPTDSGCTAGTATSAGASLPAPAGDNLLYLCARDRTGRVSQWSGQYRIDAAAPTTPGPTTVACAYATLDDCWVTGGFTASAAPSTDAAGIAGYRICRSNDSSGGFAGCDADLAPVGGGGTSIAVSGSHLPSDGFRRAYYFQAKDNTGVWSDWNAPRYVRVDRQDPRVSATGASATFVAGQTAILSADDEGGAGVGANSGLAEARWAWDAAPNATCTSGASYVSGAAIAAPEGDHTLHLCARDRSGRIGRWSGQYRIALPPEIASLAPSQIDRGAVSVVRILGSRLQGATVAIATAKYDPADPARVFPTLLSSFVNAGGTEIVATIDATAAGLDGFYNLTVSKACEGCVDGAPLRVAPPGVPVVDLYTPSEVGVGQLYPIVVTGANLQGAVLTASHPQVQVLHSENTGSEMITGLLSIPAGIDPGNFEIRVEIPETLTAPVRLPVSFLAGGAPTRKNVPVVSQDKLERARAQGVEVPGLFVQELTPSPSALAQMRSQAPSSPLGVGCTMGVRKRLWSPLHARVVLLDAYGNLDPRLLDAVGLGELKKFGALTVSFFADIYLDFVFDPCRMTDLFFCITGTIGTEVIGLDGVWATFTFCQGTHHEQTVETSGGRLRNLQLSSAGACTQVTQLTPPTGGGQAYSEGDRGAHYANVELEQCCQEPIHARMNIETFGVSGAGEVEVAKVVPEPQSCQPGPPELTLLLDANRDNDFAAASGSVYRAFDSLSDIGKYVPCTNPDSDLPIAVGQQQTMSVVAAYVRRLGENALIVAPPAGVTGVSFELPGGQTSNFPGIAMNWPPAEQANQDPDFLLGEGSGPVQVQFTPGHLAPVTLTCRDYGGYTTLRATPNSGTAASLVLPKPQADPGDPALPAAGWRAGEVAVAAGSRKAKDDLDDTPVVTAAGGPGQLKGDGLATYAEYRGFVVGGQLRRLDPDRKDIFLRNHLPAAAGLGHVPELGLTVNVVDENEFFKTPSGSSEFRIVDFNGDNRIIYGGQSVIRLVEDPATPPAGGGIQLGVTQGELSEANQSPQSRVFGNVIATVVAAGAANSNFTRQSLYDWVLSHEVGHAVGLCHRQENSQGAPVDQTTGQPLADPGHCPAAEGGGAMIPQAAIPGGVTIMHSGVVIDRVRQDGQYDTQVTDYDPASIRQIRLNPNPQQP